MNDGGSDSGYVRGRVLHRSTSRQSNASEGADWIMKRQLLLELVDVTEARQRGRDGDSCLVLRAACDPVSETQ
jgi:hypothetical protein